jgi:hypothetical protein
VLVSAAVCVPVFAQNTGYLKTSVIPGRAGGLD